MRSRSGLGVPLIISFARVAAICCALAFGTTPGVAQSSSVTASDTRTKELDALFSDLQSAKTQAEADALVARISAVWKHSGRDDIDVMMSRVDANMAGQNFGLAIVLVEEVLDLMPSFTEAHVKRAMLLYRMEEREHALAVIGSALAIEPRHFRALALRAAIQADLGRWTEALEAYRAALALNPFLASRHRVLPGLEKKAAERGL